MNRYHEMKVFLAVAQARSLAAAARALALSIPTLTRALNTLETRLAANLVVRTPRGVSLTPAGERYAQDCQRLLAAVQEAEASASGLHAELRGQLRIAAPLHLGQSLLMPIVLDFMHAYPLVQVDARFMDREPHLHEEDIDVAIVMGPLPDSSLFALPIGAFRRVIVASPIYLTQYGVPDTPQDLRTHRLLHSLADARLPEWQFQENGKGYQHRFKPQLSTATNASALKAAQLGAGLARCWGYQAEEACARGDLQRVLEPFEPTGQLAHVVYRDGRRAAARVRCFVDFAVARLRADYFN